MPIKKEKEPLELLSFSTIIVFCLYAVLLGSFLFLLSISSNVPFSISDFAVALGITLAITGFLLVVRSVINTNRLEGLILGLVTIIAAIAALLMRFKGIYTYGFAAAGAIIAIVYIAYFFGRTKQQDLESL